MDVLVVQGSKETSGDVDVRSIALKLALMKSDQVSLYCRM